MIPKSGPIYKTVIPGDRALGRRDVWITGPAMCRCAGLLCQEGLPSNKGAFLFLVLEHLTVGAGVRGSVAMSTYPGSQPSCLGISRLICLLARNQPLLTGQAPSWTPTRSNEPGARAVLGYDIGGSP